MDKIKNLFYNIIILIIVFSAVVTLANVEVTENGNSKRCLDAAKRIGEIEGVDTVVVLKNKGRILAGVRCGDEPRGFVTLKSQSIVKGLFPSAKGCRIEVENETAEKIIELSYFVDADMAKSVLESRFEFLWNI